MRRRLIAAAGDLQPDDMMFINDAQRVHALGRHVHATVGRRGADKENLLLCYELGKYFWISAGWATILSLVLNKQKMESDMADMKVAVKPAVKTEQELRVQREQIYCKETKGGAPYTPGAIAQALELTNANEIPSMNNRDHNFNDLVKYNFYVEKDPSAVYYNFSWPLHGLTYTKAYKTLQEYSKTPYGAVFIRKILIDNNRRDVPRFFYPT